MLVWDVGHQAYGHKILTGRRDQFHTLRQYGGISGFPRREESVYDVFNVAHASTSISAALGMAVARDLQAQHQYVVAIIGDGGLTGKVIKLADWKDRNQTSLKPCEPEETDIVVLLGRDEETAAG